MFTCKFCNYSTKVKCNYIKHINTSKHKKMEEKCKTIETLNEKMNTNEHKMNTNEHKNFQKNESFICEFCSKKFNTKASMRRHQLHYCKEAPQSSYKVELKREKREKKQLYKKIEQLLEENGKAINNINSHNTINNNNTNNIQQNNNIVINNYGDEDLSHITTSVLDRLIKMPGDMINNLTKMIHFNQNKPENMNMYIPSRKQKFIKVFRKNEWILEKKHERIPDLVDRNYNIIDSYYEDHGGCEGLNKMAKKNYELYQKLIDSRDEKVIKKEYDSCELEILNNSQKVIEQHNLTK